MLAVRAIDLGPMRLASLLVCLFVLPASASPGKQPPKPIDTLFAELKQAATPEDAKPIEDQIDVMFMASGSPSVDLLMNRGTQALAGGDTGTARKIFDSVTAIAPNYAEGWHNRAALQVASKDNEGAMLSLERVVRLNPREFKAMSELGDMLEDYGDKADALKLYRRAVALDPKLDGAADHIKALETAVEGQRI